MEQLVKVISVLMFFYVATSYAQDTIHWDKQRPLAWEDFRGTPEDNAIESAQAATGVALAFQYREDLENNTWEYKYEAHSFFLTDLSWYKKQDINYYLLEHEQTHFNISEFYARKLRYELSKLMASESVGDDAERIYNKIQKEHKTLQNKYDRETKHSLHIDRELEWQKQIQDSLKQYNDWK